MKITLELTGTLQLAALEMALEMFEGYATEPDPKRTPRERAVCKAGIELLARVRGEHA